MSNENSPVEVSERESRTARHDNHGETIELDWSSTPSPLAPTEKGARKVEDTRAYLAFALVGLLALSVLGLMILLVRGDVPPESFAEIAGILVSPLVGLVGAVAGYYYGKADQR